MFTIEGGMDSLKLTLVKTLPLGPTLVFLIEELGRFSTELVYQLNCIILMCVAFLACHLSLTLILILATFLIFTISITLTIKKLILQLPGSRVCSRLNFPGILVSVS